jgi:hypothetical protein
MHLLATRCARLILVLVAITTTLTLSSVATSEAVVTGKVGGLDAGQTFTLTVCRSQAMTVATGAAMPKTSMMSDCKTALTGSAGELDAGDAATESDAERWPWGPVQAKVIRTNMIPRRDPIRRRSRGKSQK